MSTPTKKPILALCHTLLHDAFFYHGGDISNWKDAQFLLNFLIVQKADLSESQYLAITTRKIMDEFKRKFENEVTAPRSYQMLSVLEDCIKVNAKEDIEKLNDDEGVIAIADTLYNHGAYLPIIVSSMAPKKRQIAQEFYKKYGQDRVPFDIYSYGEIRAFLKATDEYKGTYSIVEELMNRQRPS